MSCDRLSFSFVLPWKTDIYSDPKARMEFCSAMFDGITMFHLNEYDNTEITIIMNKFGNTCNIIIRIFTSSEYLSYFPKVNVFVCRVVCKYSRYLSRKLEQLYVYQEWTQYMNILMSNSRNFMRVVIVNWRFNYNR